MNSNLKLIISGAVLSLSVLGSSASFAQIVVPTTVAAFKAMDVNNDGKLSRAEFLTAMTKVFDKHAGAKGYCTPDEAAGTMVEISDSFFKKSNVQGG